MLFLSKYFSQEHILTFGNCQSIYFESDDSAVCGASSQLKARRLCQICNLDVSVDDAGSFEFHFLPSCPWICWICCDSTMSSLISDLSSLFSLSLSLSQPWTCLRYWVLLSTAVLGCPPWVSPCSFAWGGLLPNSGALLVLQGACQIKTCLASSGRFHVHLWLWIRREARTAKLPHIDARLDSQNGTQIGPAKHLAESWLCWSGVLQLGQALGVQTFFDFQEWWELTIIDSNIGNVEWYRINIEYWVYIKWSRRVKRCK